MKKNIIILITILVGASIIIAAISKKYRTEKPVFDTPVEISLLYEFKTEKAEQLSILAFDLMQDKKYDQAIELYTKAIKVEPSNPILYFDVADCYSRIKKFKDAISALDKAIILDSLNAFFYTNRGLYNYKLHENKEAINNFKRALQLDSTNWVIFSNLSLSYYASDSIINACIALDQSKRFGLDLSGDGREELKVINKICNN